MKKGILISGKGKSTKAIELSKEFKSVVRIGGTYTGYNLHKCPMLTPKTDCIIFDDLQTPFRISTLYEVIRNGIITRLKYNDEFSISPTIIVCNPRAILIGSEIDLNYHFDKIEL